jgi:phospholipase C
MLPSVVACGGGSGTPSNPAPRATPIPGPTTSAAPSAAPSATPTPVAGTLQHLVFIVQENRSFDSYFGTYPGANGIPTSPPCQLDPWYPSACRKPYPDHDDSNLGGPYENPYQVIQIDNGKMDGFVEAKEQQLGLKCRPKSDGAVPRGVVSYPDPELGRRDSSECTIDVMGYHDGTDLPNYWTYAHDYVLQDNFYESVESWSQPAHLALFSGWSAVCSQLDPPNINSCASSLNGSTWNPAGPNAIPFLWTDITYLLYENNISWKAYLDGGLGAPVGPPNDAVQGIWIPLGGFETVNQDGQYLDAVGNTTAQFYSDAAAGTLPQVSWLIPDYYDSEHPQASISQGQTYVTGLINAIAGGPTQQWNSTAVFIVWDDMGGFYDHQPPGFNFDSLGLGMRVPALIVSPLAKRGYIDHQLCSTDCYLSLIENVFLNGERMSRAGRPDPRPDYRDAQTAYGNLLNDFELTAKPRKPLVLRTHPMTLLRPPATRRP